MSDHQTGHEVIPGVGVPGPARRRGRPPIPVTDAIMEQRRLSRQRVNARRSESMDVQRPARKRGRPPITVTDEVLDQRRLSRQRVNAQRSEGVGTSRGRGRPRGARNRPNLERGPLSIPHTGCVSTQGLACGGEAEIGPEVGAAAANQQLTPAKEALIPGESQRMRRSIERKKKEFMETNMILSMGRQEETCGYCKAQVWAAEFTGRHIGTGPKGYTICCGKGKVQLPILRPPPLS